MSDLEDTIEKTDLNSVRDRFVKWVKGNTMKVIVGQTVIILLLLLFKH